MSTDLIFVKQTMSSIEVAELTGKQHSNVMRDIRALLEQGVSQFNFESAQYVDSQGKPRPCYNITKKGCLILASGYDAKLREKIIDRWEELEMQNRDKMPKTFAEALRLAAEQAEEIERQQKQIEEDAPRVLFSKAVETAKRSCLVAELAKILKQNGVEIGQNRLFAWLREREYLCKKGENYNLPTQKAMELGLFEIKKSVIHKPDGSSIVTTTTKVTTRGQIYFVNKFIGEKERNVFCGDE